jgi:hypothetical protein
MFSCLCKDYCIQNYELNQNQYDKIMDKIENNETFTITTLVKQNRQNDFIRFLIVLADKHYQIKHFWSSQSLYDKLLKEEFPGTIDIVKLEDLQKSTDFIVKEAVVLKKLYIRLPKENLYIDSSKYEEYLINSITNEFLRVISTLKPMSIKIQMFNQNKNEFEFDVNTSISFQGVDLGSDVKNQQTNNSSNKKEWLLTFRKDKIKMDLSCFLDSSKFYYLPKYTEWTDLIHNRVNYNVNTAKYVYEHTIDNNINLEFVEKMKFLNIDCKYKKSKYENIRFEYEIDYYPL